MRIAILGNGSIGSTIALKLGAAGHKVYLFGDTVRSGSASVAAGAMLNVFGEIENNHFEHEGLKKKFELAHTSLLHEWPNFIKKNFPKKYYDLFKKRNTIIFNNKFSSPYELSHFNYLKKISKNYKDEVFINIRKPNTFTLENSKEFIGLKEGFINTKSFFHYVDMNLNKFRVKVINGYQKYLINIKNQNIILKLSGNKKENKEFTFDYLVIAMGSYSEKIFFQNKTLFKNVQKIFFGTGCAFNLSARNYIKQIKHDNKVYRTMNRGNACGFHIVPNENSNFYFGASSTVSHKEEFFPRLSSVKVLCEGLEKQIDHRFNNYIIESRFGHRPVSSDTFPLLGKIKKNPRIIIATGNKRDGFTCSPYIASLVAEYISGNKDAFERFKIFNPERNLISYFDKNTAIKQASEAKISGECMHYKNPDFSNWNKKILLRSKEYKKIYDNINLSDKSFGIHPELLSLFFNKRIFKR